MFLFPQRNPLCVWTCTGASPADRDQAYLPKNFCALLKVTLASFVEGNEPDPSLFLRCAQDFGSELAPSLHSGQAPHGVKGQALEAVVFLDSCDAMRRLHDVWRACVDVAVLAFLDLPRANTPLAHDYFFRTLQQFLSELEKHFGQPLTGEALAASIRAYNHQRSLLSALRAGRAQGHLGALAYHDLCRATHIQDPRVANAQLEAALARMDSNYGTGPRLLLVGSLFVNRGLVALLEERGAQIVAEDTCADGREDIEPVRASGDVAHMLRELAARYLAKPPCPRMRDLPRRLDYLAHLVTGHQVDGIICAYFKFCDLFLAEFPALKALGKPIILIEDEGEVTLSGQARTRVEAFLEMLG